MAFPRIGAERMTTTERTRRKRKLDKEKMDALQRENDELRIQLQAAIYRVHDLEQDIAAIESNLEEAERAMTTLENDLTASRNAVRLLTEPTP